MDLLIFAFGFLLVLGIGAFIEEEIL